MKKKELYNLISKAVKNYESEWKTKLVPVYISKKKLTDEFSKFNKLSLVKNSFCCYGFYKCCWQDSFFAGNWGLTQSAVNDIIYNTIEKTYKFWEKDRIRIWQDDKTILIIMRDNPNFKCDYIINLEG